MKKIVAACLFLLLLLPGQALADTTAPAPEAAAGLVVEYANIAALMTERNPVIRSNADILRAMDYGYASLEDSLAMASKAASAFGRLADSVVVSEDPNSFILKEYLAGQEATLVNTAVGILDTQEDMERMIERTKLQMEAGNEQIIRAAEGLYFTYHRLRQQQADLSDNLGLLQRQLKVTRLRREIGLASEYDVLVMEARVRELANGLDTLAGQTDNLLRNFNLLLGRAYDAPLELAEPPALPEDSGADAGSAADASAAEANSYSIKLQQYSLGDKKVAYRRLKEENGLRDSDVEDKDNAGKRWYNRAQQLRAEMRSEEEKLNEIIRNFHSEFAQAAQAVRDKAAALELAELNLAKEAVTLGQMTLRYELGLLSGLALEGVKAGYAAQERKMRAAEWELLQARRQYEWMQQGLSFAAAGAAF